MKAMPNIVFCEEEDGTGILFNSDTGQAFGLNNSGKEIWRCLVREMRTEEIIEHLLSRFDCNAAEAAADLETFVVALREKGFLESPGLTVA